MRRKIQRQPKRSYQSRLSEEYPPAKGINIQEAVTVLGGLTGILVASFWLAGRFYAAGYFGAMNIPYYQINFSVWEYAELSWLRLIFYFLNRIYPFLVLFATVPLTLLFSVFILQRLFPTLRLAAAIRNIVAQIEGLRVNITYLVLFSLIIYFSYLFVEALTDIRKTGELAGRRIVLSDNYAVQVYSKDYLPLGTPRVLSGTTPPVLEYSGLRLLTFNNGKYYLFREVDPINCSPLHVFIVTDSPDIIIVLSSVDAIDPPCATTPTASPVPEEADD